MLSANSSEHLSDDAFELWKFFFQEHLILDNKTTSGLQKPHCENIWWNILKMKVVSVI